MVSSCRAPAAALGQRARSRCGRSCCGILASSRASRSRYPLFPAGGLRCVLPNHPLRSRGSSGCWPAAVARPPAWRRSSRRPQKVGAARLEHHSRYQCAGAWLGGDTTFLRTDLRKDLRTFLRIDLRTQGGVAAMALRNSWILSAVRLGCAPARLVAQALPSFCFS